MTKEKPDAVYAMDNDFNILAGEKIFRSKAVIIAVGIDYGQSIPGEIEFLGKGAGYCATCDAPLYQGKTVAIIGYTREGEEEANFLSEVCRKVYYLPQYENVGHLHDNIEVLKDKPKEIVGEKFVSQLVLHNSRLEVEGVFMIKETAPLQQLVPGLEMDGQHIKVDRHMMTNIQGLYAAGDCAGKPYGLSKAAGEGQIAALQAVGYLDKLH